MADMDIYRMGAAMRLGIPYDSVTKAQRTEFKQRNYFRMYGGRCGEGKWDTNPIEYPSDIAAEAMSGTLLEGEWKCIQSDPAQSTDTSEVSSSSITAASSAGSLTSAKRRKPRRR